MDVRLRTRLSALAIATLVVPAATAQDRYFTIHGAYGPFITDHDYVAPNSNAVGPLTGTIEYDDAFILGGSVGMFVSPNRRIGVEVSYFDVNTETFSRSSPNLFPVDETLELSGDIRGASIFLEAAVERQFTPTFGGYIEGGLGLLYIDGDATPDPNAFNGFLDDSDTVFAAKIGGGLTYRLTARTEFFSEYSFVVGEDAHLEFTSPGSGIERVPFSIETSSHATQIGLRVRF